MLHFSITHRLGIESEYCNFLVFKRNDLKLRADSLHELWFAMACSDEKALESSLQKIADLCAVWGDFCAEEAQTAFVLKEKLFMELRLVSSIRQDCTLRMKLFSGWNKPLRLIPLLPRSFLALLCSLWTLQLMIFQRLYIQIAQLKVSQELKASVVESA